MLFLTRERSEKMLPAAVNDPVSPRHPLPRAFWLFLIGVFFFGLGDFSRTFLIFLAAQSLGNTGSQTSDLFYFVVLLYALHNLISAVVAFPVGYLGDRHGKLPLLAGGYSLAVVTNLILALAAGSLSWLVVSIVLSGIYIAVGETLEKAVAVSMLSRDQRSLGLGILASVNAVGDMVSSLYVGFALEAHWSDFGFGLAAVFAFIGISWLGWLSRRNTRLVVHSA
jgi:MFS family permease